MKDIKVNLGGNEYNRMDLGCHGDGTFGHDHIRYRLAELVDAVDGFIGNEAAMELIASLQGEMPDDAWDEDEALELLNSVTEDGAQWILDGGDLLLVEEHG